MIYKEISVITVNITEYSHRTLYNGSGIIFLVYAVLQKKKKIDNLTKYFINNLCPMVL